MGDLLRRIASWWGIGGTTCCQMCKRLVINAGIERVIVREDAERYTVYMVRDWVENDDSLGQIGY